MWVLYDDGERRDILRRLGLLQLKRLQCDRIVLESQLSEVIYERFGRQMDGFLIQAISMLGVLERAKGYISGSITLGLIHAGTESKSMDIYVGKGGGEKVVRFLKETEGKYKDGQESAGEGCAGMGPMKTVALMRSEKVNKVIKVYETEGNPLFGVLQQECTALLNYVGWHGLVVTYPVLTGEKMGLVYGGSDQSVRAKEEVMEMRRQGFSIARSFGGSNHQCGSDINCPHTYRSLHDRHVWHVRFPQYMEVEGSKLRREHDASKCSWRLASGSSCRTGGDGDREWVVEIDGERRGQ